MSFGRVALLDDGKKLSWNGNNNDDGSVVEDAKGPKQHIGFFVGLPLPIGVWFVYKVLWA